MNTKAKPADDSEPIFCDDCGLEKMAEVRDGKLVIVDRRHGRQHVAIVEVIRKDKKKRSAKLRTLTRHSRARGNP